ncbi:MAG: hypothetical protein ACLFVJ_23130 [Persicimonas sp.]
MKWRLRLSNLSLMLLGLWAGKAHAQQPTVEEPSSTDGQQSSDVQEDAQPREHFDPDKPIFCMEDEGGEWIRLQCDHQEQRCLIARSHADIPAARIAARERMMERCRPSEPGDLQKLREDGYEMVPAFATRYGYKRDEQGRIYQTHFDLRRRVILGIYDQMSLSGDHAGEHRLSAEIGGVIELYDPDERKRHRHQFLRGQVHLDPLEATGLLYGYDRGRVSDEPALRIVEFVTPEPDRYDIWLNLGPGARLGRLSYEEIAGTHELLLDVGQAHINWEVLQHHDEGLEDYVLVRAGIGGGLAAVDGEESATTYGYPEVGVEGAWLIDERGLTQLRFDGALRKLWDVDGGERELAHAQLDVERVVVSINDQPITLFARTGVEYRSGPLAEEGLTSFEALVGGRVSFFVPTRPAYGGQ